MNRSIFRLFAIIAIAGLAFTGCQKEENLLEPENNMEEQMISFWDVHPELEHLKGNKVDPSEIPDIIESVVHVNGRLQKSFTVGGLEWTNADGDEISWFNQNFTQFPNASGMTPDHYYKYEQTTSNSFYANSGWRIPDDDDMANLIQVCGGDESIIEMVLSIGADGAYYIWSSTYQTYDNMNGDVIFWTSANITSTPDYWEAFRFHNGELYYSDIAPGYACKVRLVRDAN